MLYETLEALDGPWEGRVGMRCWVALLLAAVFLPSSMAAAASITRSYSGVIDQFNDPGSLLDPAVTSGAAFTAEVTVTTDLPTSSMGTPTITYYSSSQVPTESFVSVSLSIGGVQLNTDWEGISIGNDSNVFSPSATLDFWTVSYQLPYSGPSGTALISVSFSDSSGLKLANQDFFVPSDTDLSGWGSARLLISDPNAPCTPNECPLAAGDLSPIPEPTTALLLGLGLIGLGVQRQAIGSVS